MRCLSTTSPIYLLALLVILTLNITLLAVCRNRLVLIKRSGNALLINLILLIFGGHPNIFSDRVSVPREYKSFLHHWLGAIALLECIVHVATALSSRKPSRFRSTPTKILLRGSLRKTINSSLMGTTRPKSPSIC